MAAHDHSHAVNENRLFWVAALTGTFMVVEAIGGVISGSLALIADAAHMLTDFAGLAIAWLAFRMSRRPADERRTYGFARMQVVVAFGNGIMLFVIAAFIVIEAVRRLAEPFEVLGGTMLFVAAAGLVVNIVAFFVLHGAERENLNVRGAMIHVLGDLLGSVGAIAAALIILATGWTPADPILSVLVAVIILRSAWLVVRDSGHILLEGTPAGVSIADIERDLPEAVPGVCDVHHIHAWSITQEDTMITLHAQIDDATAPDTATAGIKKRLRERFGIGHATIEVERGACADRNHAQAAAVARDHAHADHDHGGDHGGHTHDHGRDPGR